MEGQSKETKSQLSKLSRSAREQYESLERGLRAIVERDRVREPKLTDVERSQIAELQARADKLDAIFPSIEKEFTEKETRLTQLNESAAQMVMDGGNAIEIASEHLIVERAYHLLDDAVIKAASNSAIAKQEIEHIKENARKRELAEERGRVE